MVINNPNNARGPLPGRPFLPPQQPESSPAPTKLTASMLEYAQLFRLLAQPPPRGELDPLMYHSLVNEIRQVVNFAQEHQRLVHTDIINGIVQNALREHCKQQRIDPWELEKIEDGKRKGTDRTYTFGQITDRGEACFAGLWHIRRTFGRGLVQFKIAAVPELIDAIQIRLHQLPNEESRRMYQRGPKSWQHQVPVDSELGRWIEQIFGTRTLGYYNGLPPLGVFTDAIRRFADAERLSHLLLPRSRREPGTNPWHIGAFMQFDGEQFVWSGYCISARGIPLKLTLGIRPHCEILGLKPLPRILNDRS